MIHRLQNRNQHPGARRPGAMLKLAMMAGLALASCGVDEETTPQAPIETTVPVTSTQTSTSIVATTTTTVAPPPELPIAGFETTDADVEAIKFLLASGGMAWTPLPGQSSLAGDDAGFINHVDADTGESGFECEPGESFLIVMSNPLDYGVYPYTDADGETQYYSLAAQTDTDPPQQIAIRCMMVAAGN